MVHKVSYARRLTPSSSSPLAFLRQQRARYGLSRQGNGERGGGGIERKRGERQRKRGGERQRKKPASSHRVVVDRRRVDLAGHGAPREHLRHDVRLPGDRSVLSDGGVGEALDRLALLVEALSQKHKRLHVMCCSQRLMRRVGLKPPTLCAAITKRFSSLFITALFSAACWNVQVLCRPLTLDWQRFRIFFSFCVHKRRVCIIGKKKTSTSCRPPSEHEHAFPKECRQVLVAVQHHNNIPLLSRTSICQRDGFVELYKRKQKNELPKPHTLHMQSSALAFSTKW